MLALRVTDHRSVRRGCAWLEALRTRWLRVRSAPAIHTTKHLLACLCKRAPRGAAPFCGVRFRLVWGRRWRPFLSWFLAPHLSPSAALYNRVSYANLDYCCSGSGCAGRSWCRRGDVGSERRRMRGRSGPTVASVASRRCGTTLGGLWESCCALYYMVVQTVLDARCHVCVTDFASA